MPEHLVKGAVFVQSFNTAPGLQKLSFKATWLPSKQNKTRVVGITKLAAWTERLPTVCNNASCVADSRTSKLGQYEAEAILNNLLVQLRGDSV